LNYDKSPNERYFHHGMVMGTTIWIQQKENKAAEKAKGITPDP
jgi:hypothetical protein